MKTPDLLRTFGSLLSMARELRGMTQAELAKRSGVSQAMISKCEAGQVSVDIGTLYVMADALELPPKRFLP